MNEYYEEYPKIGGIEQYLLHYPSQNKEAPVLLYLHGGPGGTEAPYAFEFKKSWGDLFHMVHWDQRGTSKTFVKNPDSIPTMELLLEDLKSVIIYLLEKYKQEKIVLLGHSWGSVLGTLFIKQYPQYIEYFIGVSQVIDMLENETVGFHKLCEVVSASHSQKDKRQMNAIGKYPVSDYKSMSQKMMTVRKLQQKYGLAYKPTLSDVILLLKSPVFGFSDLIKSVNTKEQQANTGLLKELLSYSLYQYDFKYEVPIYFIFGETDYQAPYSVAEKYYKKIETSRKDIFLISGAGHNPMLEKPETFAKILSNINKKENSIHNEIA